jgi:hypothetical protein
VVLDDSPAPDVLLLEGEATEDEVDELVVSFV